MWQNTCIHLFYMRLLMSIPDFLIFSAPDFVLWHYRRKDGRAREIDIRNDDRARILRETAEVFYRSNSSRLMEVVARDYPEKSLEECLALNTKHLISLAGDCQEPFNVRLAALDVLRGMSDAVPSFRCFIVERVAHVFAQEGFDTPLWEAAGYFISDQRQPQRRQGHQGQSPPFEMPAWMQLVIQ
jgi:hypothetical protein